MNYYRLGFWLLAAWMVIIWVFSLGLNHKESFHAAHYFWLLVATGIIVWVERRKSKKNKIVGNPICR